MPPVAPGEPGPLVNKPSKKKRVLLIIGVVIIAVAAGVAVAMYFSHRAETTADSGSQSGKTVAQVKASDPTQKLQDQATTAVQQGGEAAGQKVYDNALKTTTDKTTEGQIYLLKSSLASQSGDNTTALQYALQADQVVGSAATAASVGQLEEALGNTPDAIKYYNLYLSRASGAEKQSPDYSGIQAHVKQLEGQS